MREKRTANFIFLLLAALFISAVLLGTLRGLTRDVSYYENRSLAPAPELSAAALLNGETAAQTESFLTDRAMARTTLLKYKTMAELTLGLPVVNGIVPADSVLLPYLAPGSADAETVPELSDTMADALAGLDAYIESLGGKFYYLGLPCQYYVYGDEYPDYLESRGEYLDAVYDVFPAALGDRGVRFIDLLEAYGGREGAREYFMGTDHHFSFTGAMAAYRALMDEINTDTMLALPVLGEDDVALTTLPNPFLGSRNREIYGLRGMGEGLTVPVFASPVAFERWDNGESVEPYLLALPENESDTVTYSAFMGGDWGETIITTGRPELPDILIFGDSFSNAVETLLYSSFDELRSLDLRNYSEKTLREYIAEYEPDIVVCIRDVTVFLSPDGNGRIE